MATPTKSDRRGLRDWFIITVIILIGFLCLIVAGSMAVRFAPRWQLSSNMDSRLDPNSDYLTNRPQSYIEPVDESILTPPIWIDFFQTPGASVPQRTPLPTRTVTVAPIMTSAVMPTTTATRPAAGIPSPTNTIVYPIPVSATNTQRPAPQPTSTDTPFANTDLEITKDDGVLTYSAGSMLTYTIIITNHGPADVIGAVVADSRPTQIQSWVWKCTSQSLGGKGCDPDTSNPAIFYDVINLPNGASVEYTVDAMVQANAAGNLVNTATVTLPSNYIDTNLVNNTESDSNIPLLDLQITVTDSVNTYTPGGTTTYTLTVTNNSSFDMSGVAISDPIPVLVTSWGWCIAPCVPAANTTANLNDTINLTAGSGISYYILASINPNAAGTLTNTASVSVPAGYVDAAPGNNSDTDADINQTGEPDVGPPDGTILPIGDGGSATFYLSQPIEANGDSAADFAYYELIMGGSIFLDHVYIDISADGVNWYRVFFWGDGSPDTNSNVDNVNLPNIAAACPTEVDNCQLSPTELHNGSGITVDVDAYAPAGNYAWIKFTEPGITPGDGTHVDSIELLP